MTNRELQAIRRICFISVKEAADHIGGVSARTWQRWENDEFTIPDDVAFAMRALALARRELIDTNYYANYLSHREFAERYKNTSVIDWRLSQSVAAQRI